MTTRQEHDAKSKSIIITALCGIAILLLLFMQLSFYKEVDKIQPIEIAMNFGTTETGSGLEEPKPITIPIETSSNTITEEKTDEKHSISMPSESKPVITENNESPVSVPKPTKKKNTNQSSKRSEESKDNEPKNNNSKANNALASLIGGKGSSHSNGDGTSGQIGNASDPKGKNSTGKGIGQEWKSRIPTPISHNCNASGTIVLNITVNKQGGIKRAVPGGRGSTSTDKCLEKKAISLVKKYVRAFPGEDNRTGTYDVILK